MGVLKALALFFRVGFVTRVHLTVEILALRQQLAVMKRSRKRPKLRPRDRVFWTWLMRLWPHWKSALIIVGAKELCLHSGNVGNGRSFLRYRIGGRGHFLVITHCNRRAGYLPPKHLYDEGGYEIDRTGFAPQAADILAKESLRMLSELN